MSDDLAPGKIIGERYRVVRRLGVGGMGTVYLASAEGAAGFSKPVAVKIAHDDLGGDAELFLSEARITAQLQHANLGQVLDLGKSDGAFFIAMEYIRGVDLRRLMTAATEAGERLPVALVAFIVSRLLAALDYAHRFRDKQGKPLRLVHRDVTPVNCLLSYAGEVKLIDFGIAKAANQASKTRAGFVRGKPQYMSPEQVKAVTLDGRSDVFAVGVVLYELLMGFRPFDSGNDRELVANLMAGKYQTPRELDDTISVELETIVTHALEPDREQRFQSAGAMQDVLEQWLASTRVRAGQRELAAYVARMCPPEPDLAFEDVTGKIEVVTGVEPAVDLAGRVTLKSIPPFVQRPSQETRLKPQALGVKTVPMPPVPGVVPMAPERDRTTAKGTALRPLPWLPMLAALGSLLLGAGVVLLVQQLGRPVEPPPVPVYVEPQIAAVVPKNMVLLSVSATAEAEVFVDAVRVGNAPVKVAVKAGKHEVRVDCIGRPKGQPEIVTAAANQGVDLRHPCPP